MDIMEYFGPSWEAFRHVVEFGVQRQSSLMELLLRWGLSHHETVVNASDLISFLLITPEVSQKLSVHSGLKIFVLSLPQIVMATVSCMPVALIIDFILEKILPLYMAFYIRIAIVLLALAYCLIQVTVSSKQIRELTDLASARRMLWVGVGIFVFSRVFAIYSSLAES